MSAQILLITNMYSPLLSGWFIPLVQWIGDESIVHYPQHIAYIPLVFEKMNLIFSWLLDSVLSASAVLMFAAYFDKEKVRFSKSLREAMRQYPKLLLIWLAVFLPILLLFWALPGLFESFVEGSPRRKIMLMIGMQGMQTVLTALFIYVVPYLLLRGASLGQAFTRNFSLFFRSFFTTIVLVGIPQFLMLPFIYAMQNTGTIVNKFNPSVIIWLSISWAAVLVLANYFTTGSIVRFFREIAED